MPGCATCRQRKVKCDGRPELCRRCDKLELHCQWNANSPHTARSHTEEVIPPEGTTKLTQAGHKRFRISLACETCRKRKLKCDALRPSCSSCLRRKLDCMYGSSRETRPHQRQATLDSLADSDNQGNLPAHGRIAGSRETNEFNGETEQAASQTAIQDREREGSATEELGMAQNIAAEKDGPSISRSSHIPSGSDLLPYIDSFLENIHPICCNNFLHPGVLYEELDNAPELLVLAICGASAKFLPDARSRTKGRHWIEEARSLIFNSLDCVSTLTLTAIQFQVMHDIHEAQFVSAWNLIGIGTRLALQLKLNQNTPVIASPDNFLQQEVRRRLMWSVFVTDLLFSSDTNYISEELLSHLPLPCNLWNFTQGIPCTTLQLWQLSGRLTDGAVKQATNPCAYLIQILVLRRKILRFNLRYQEFDGGSPWLERSYFQMLCDELQNWRRNLPGSFVFEGRHLYTFRSSRHLDLFLMIHAWYHQAACALFGTWMLGVAGDASVTARLEAPEGFLPKCEGRALLHARNITSLIQKVLKVEPDHVFRDAWFGLCVLDSTRVQLAKLQQNDSNDLKEETAKFLQLNLRALTNTMKKIPLAEKIYKECCVVIRDVGLDSMVDLCDSHITGRAEDHFETGSPGITFDLFRRYPFLKPTDPPHPEKWDLLFNSTNFAGSSTATRDVSPEADDHILLDRPDVHQSGSTSNIPDLPFIYEDPMQLFNDWAMDGFHWQQPDIDHTAAAALMGMNVANGGANARQDMMRFSGDSFAAASSHQFSNLQNSFN